jgi:hypothetical protein
MQHTITIAGNTVSFEDEYQNVVFVDFNSQYPIIHIYNAHDTRNYNADKKIIVCTETMTKKEMYRILPILEGLIEKSDSFDIISEIIK